MRMPSGSNLERAMLCPASVSLPKVDNLNEYAAEGTSLHSYIADALEMGPEEAIKRVPPEHVDAALAIRLLGLEKLPNHQSELAFAYDTLTEKTRVIGTNVGRSYGELSPSEIPMSADAVGLEDGRVLVADYKTGFKQVSSPKNNWQLRLGALAMARHYGKSKAWVAIIYTRGKVYTDWAEFDAIDLDSFADQLKEAYKSWTGKPKFTTGAHCSFCPSITHCDAQNGLAKRIAGKADNLDPIELYELYRAGQAQLKALEASLRARATQEPIRLRDGRYFGIAPDNKLREYKR